MSKFGKDHDLVDPVTLLIATGLRRSELLGMHWTDYDDRACTLTVSGKVVRVAGEGLQRVDETKSAAGRRTVPLPRFAVDAAEPPLAALSRLVFRMVGGHGLGL
jgi:integrase